MFWRLSDLSIRARLYAMVGAGLFGTAALLALALYALHEFSVDGPRHKPIKRARITLVEVAPPRIYLSELYLTLQEMETAKDKALDDHAETARKLLADAPGQREAAAERLDDPDLRRLIKGKVARTANEVARKAEDYLRLFKKPWADQKTISAALAEGGSAFREHRKTIMELDTAIKAYLKDSTVKVAKDLALYEWALLIVSIVCVIVGGVLGLVTAWGIISKADQLLQRVREMAQGDADLSARLPVDTADEMGQLAQGINAVVERIQAIVQKVRQSSLQLLSTASQIAATARQQGATVQGLSSSTSQVAASVGEISATSRELARTMAEVNENSTQAAALAASGRARLAGMERTMAQLVESTASISSKLATIREKADSINVVVTTITKVADQTNLLSINAAIEAEKAGEYGRGFLVVAREIRRLADQTAVATLDIENMVRHMQEAVTTGVMQMDRFSDEVRSGVGKVAEINTATGQIIDQVHAVSGRFDQVNEAMRNQAIGAEQINEAMASMTGNIRQTATALDEFNRATQHLRSSVELLNAEIAQFKV
jgi:methyl-accepting chemotaxis protein WspA